MTTSTTTIRNKQINKRKFSLSKILGISLVTLIVTIVTIIVRNIFTRDYTFELSENIPTW